MLTWEFLKYEELSREILYEILGLRQMVFVVEQRCAYQDADGRDDHAGHLLGRDEQGRLVAYLRIVEPGRRFAEPSIGRVVVRPELRGKGLGAVLMEEGIRMCTEIYPGVSIHVSAQQHLRRFYERLGFHCLNEGNPYDEDGIPHIEMVFRPPEP
jgi:ElaA protein